MLGKIDPPSTPVIAKDPRRAEDSDTRQALQRHDPEFERKKKKDGEHQGFKDPYEDLTDVSVPALRNFLLGLLDHMPSPDETGILYEPSHHETRLPANPKAAAAMNAYQSGATRGVANHPQPTKNPEPHSTGTALDQAAASLDRAAVLDLIRDLDRLATEGTAEIALEKGDNFLASIATAISKAR